MQVISSGKSTQLHSFPALTIDFTYAHAGDQRLDLQAQCKADRNLFLAVNPTLSGFELLRKTTKAGTPPVDVISRVKKVLLNDVRSGACSGARRNEVALGQENGTIRFYDLKKTQMSSMRFKAENTRKSVSQLAYSSCDEMLSAIYDDNEIKIFGLTTSVKMDQYQLDRNSTLARFHPTKRFQLGVASYAGTVTVLDVQSKKPIFKLVRAHTDAPCSDLCWSSTDANTLISVGYDCRLNVYDMRQRAIVQQLGDLSPLNTVAISPCGSYCCTGSLRGDLNAYDLRVMRAPLTYRKDVHSGQVVRVAFAVPERERESGGHAAAAAVDNVKENIPSASSDSNRFANMLGFGMRSDEQSMNRSGRPSVVRVEARPSLSGGRTSLSASDAQNSFNDFINKCNRVPESFNSRRDSLFDMEVQPVRLADWSDCDLSLTGPASRRSSVLTASNSVPNTPPEFKAGFHKRRSTIRQPVADVIPEDDQPASLPGSDSGTQQEHHQPPNLMSSTINESATSRPSIILNEMDKENLLHTIGSSVVIRSPTKRTRRQMNPDEIDHQQPDMAARLTAIEAQLAQLSTSQLDTCGALLATQSTLRDLNWFLHFKLWTLEDTDLAAMRAGLAEVNETMAQLARSDRFISQFEALKDENAKLRSQLRAALVKRESTTGDQDMPYGDDVPRTMGLLG